MYTAVSAGTFETLTIPLRAGRQVERADVEERRPVAWVNETFVRQFLGARALGEHIRVSGDTTWQEIVGVVGDVRTFGIRDDIRPMVYLPLSTSVRTVPVDLAHLVVRTTTPPAAFGTAVRAAINRVDASVPLTTIRTMDDILATSLAETAFTMTLLMLASVLALALGVIRLYGVMSDITTQRTSEIGVRLALGATPRHVLVMVLRQGLMVAMIGMAVGVAAALMLTSLMTSLVFNISPRDPATYATVILVLTIVSALASYLPARRAARIDPSVALRAEG
jgi:ABC-type lipoprotein release transport system permease subunit